MITHDVRFLEVTCSHCGRSRRYRLRIGSSMAEMTMLMTLDCSTCNRHDNVVAFGAWTWASDHGFPQRNRSLWVETQSSRSPVLARRRCFPTSASRVTPTELRNVTMLSFRGRSDPVMQSR